MKIYIRSSSSVMASKWKAPNGKSYGIVVATHTGAVATILF